MDNEGEKIYTISEFIASLNDYLKTSKAKIIGEVSDIKSYPSGYVYFKMRDEKNEAMINCKIWGTKLKTFGIELEHGLKVISYGNPEIWPARGDITFNCRTIEMAGEGELKKQYELLKKKLTDEGLFAEEKKRPIPQYVQKIGVITSGKGEVIYDFKYNLRKFGFIVKVSDSRVEGQMAVIDLLNSIKIFKREDIEVLIIIRGGGTIDSLAPMAPFNNEALIREIREFPVPVIVGIGHHRDVPLICLAADKSESTPTAVAHLLNESWEEALLLIERHERKIIDNYKYVLENIKDAIDKSTEVVKEYSDLVINKYKDIKNYLIVSIQNFKNSIINAKNNLDFSKQNLFDNFRNLLSKINQSLKNSEGVISANNPERHLKLGYSIARINNKIVKSIEDASIGDNMDLLLYNGEITSEVKNKKNKQ